MHEPLLTLSADSVPLINSQRFQQAKEIQKGDLIVFRTGRKLLQILGMRNGKPAVICQIRLEIESEQAFERMAMELGQIAGFAGVALLRIQYESDWVRQYL